MTFHFFQYIMHYISYFYVTLQAAVRATSIDHPDTHFDGEVVWMQTCFAVEDETGHHTPLCQLRAHYNITVTGNKFEGV